MNFKSNLQNPREGPKEYGTGEEREGGCTKRTDMDTTGEGEPL